MGNIKKVGENKYQFTVSLGFDINGKRRRAYKTVTAKSWEAAEAKLEDYEAQIRDSDISGNIVTFDDMVEMWKEDYANEELKKSTMSVYERLLNKNFDAFKGKRLKDIKHRDVQRWVNSLKKSGMSAKTVKNNYSLLSGIMKKAVIWEIISKSPADNIALPSVHTKEAKYYNNEEFIALLEALNTITGHELTYKVGILIAVFGGLRKGEICGLNLSDVDFEHNTISIVQTRMVEVGKGVYEDTPKTEKSVRKIELPQGVMNEIKKLVEQQAKEKASMPKDVWQYSPALLRNEIGAPLYPQVLYRWFKRFQKKNGLNDMTLHGLRHTHASLCIEDGDMTYEDLSHRLGHAQKTTTMNIYAHMFKDKGDAFAEVMNEKYFNYNSR